MARVSGRGRPGWVWPVVILLAILILAMIAWAFSAPSAPSALPTETAPAPAPAVIETTVGDIVADPSSYYGKDVILESRISRIVGDQGIYLAGTVGGDELLAVLNTPLAEADLRQDDFGRFAGTIREVNDDELSRLANIVDKPTMDALANENFYLAVSGFGPTPGELGF